MILTCNSCDKKFVVPDSAISASGRMVQCGSCGNKWKQYPINKSRKLESISRPQKIVPKSQFIKQKTKKLKKVKNAQKKTREISLYSPEYLAKKHGIRLEESKIKKIVNKIEDERISFGFYNSLILFVILIIALSRILYFSQNLIISYFPITEFYLNYFFENIRNIFEIWKNLITY